MAQQTLLKKLSAQFKKLYGMKHTVAAFAPGRVEVLGNHTDYNEGFVLSAAIDMGIMFLAAPAAGTKCRIHAADMKESYEFDLKDIKPAKSPMWANYVKGVFVKIQKLARAKTGFNAVFMGTIPLGAGLSSSAALEISSGLAFARLYGVRVKPLDLARIGQASEHDFVGVKCGLMDQLSSLHGRRSQLVITDFRSLKVGNISVGGRISLLMCNTNVKHALVSSAYNERRACCKKATTVFAKVLNHRVKALRDVSWHEWEQHSTALDPVTARRALHVIGENKRVLEGLRLLGKGNIEGFGKLMFESHESSRVNFENSCPELDFIVSTARDIPGVLGARLSGGGFGGSAVILVDPTRASGVGRLLAKAYQSEFGKKCTLKLMLPSEGAAVIED